MVMKSHKPNTENQLKEPTLSIHATTVMRNLEADPKWISPDHMRDIYINSLNELRQKGYIQYGEQESHQDIPPNSIVNRDLIIILKSIND